MKKLFLTIAIILCVACTLSAFGCTQTDSVVIYVPDGAPALSLAFLMEENATLAGRPVEIYVSDGATVKGKLLSGEADIVVLPISMGANLYNSGKDIKLGAVTVWGLNYLVGKNSIESLSELKGKVVHSIGKGDTPDLLFRNTLTSAGVAFCELSASGEIDEAKVNIKYYANGSEIVKLLKSNNAEYAVLGEPVASNAMKGAGCVEILNLQKEWKKSTGTEVAQAGVLLSRSAYTDPALVSALNKALDDNITYIAQLPEEATARMKAKGSAVAKNTTFSAELIARCNIYLKKKDSEIVAVKAYFNALKEAGAIAKAPEEGFYLK